MKGNDVELRLTVAMVIVVPTYRLRDYMHMTRRPPPNTEK
jgi:hypothetical protein